MSSSSGIWLMIFDADFECWMCTLWPSFDYWSYYSTPWKAVLVQGSPSGFSWPVLGSTVNPRPQEKEGEQLFWRGPVASWELMCICIFTTDGYLLQEIPISGSDREEWRAPAHQPPSCMSERISILRWLPMDVPGEIPLLSSLDANHATPDNSLAQNRAIKKRHGPREVGPPWIFHTRGKHQQRLRRSYRICFSHIFIPFLFAFYEYFLGSRFIVEHIYSR